MTSIEADLGADEDPRLAIFKELYVKSKSWKDFLNMVSSRISQMIMEPKQWRKPVAGSDCTLPQGVDDNTQSSGL